MRICDYCNKEIEDGYLGYDIYTICNDCIKKIYTEKELNKAYDNNEVFWTTFYDED